MNLPNDIAETAIDIPASAPRRRAEWPTHRAKQRNRRHRMAYQRRRKGRTK